MRRGEQISTPEQILERIIDFDFVFLPIAPLMHGAAQWTVLSWLYAGATTVLSTATRTDYAEIWSLVGRHRVNVLVVVGDAVARPLVEAWLAAPDAYDASSLFSIGSGGAPLSPAVRSQLAELYPSIMINDGFGSSEAGAQAGNRGDGRFTPYDAQTTVLDETTLEPVAAGSGGLGRLARRGHIPLEYHKDVEKTAATFVQSGGERWVLTGDLATVHDDGSIEILGRGSQCINTGGEKVFPEEVESALKAHPDVYDAVVVGVSDERWGERVTAVVQPREGLTPTLDELAGHCRAVLAGYKVPRVLVLVDEVVRSPVGKADYRWARQIAATSSHST